MKNQNLYVSLLQINLPEKGTARIRLSDLLPERDKDKKVAVIDRASPDANRVQLRVIDNEFIEFQDVGCRGESFDLHTTIIDEAGNARLVRVIIKRIPAFKKLADRTCGYLRVHDISIESVAGATKTISWKELAAHNRGGEFTVAFPWRYILGLDVIVSGQDKTVSFRSYGLEPGVHELVLMVSYGEYRCPVYVTLNVLAAKEAAVSAQ